jgi:hypothetical protein
MARRYNSPSEPSSQNATAGLGSGYAASSMMLARRYEVRLLASTRQRSSKLPRWYIYKLWDIQTPSCPCQARVTASKRDFSEYSTCHGLITQPKRVMCLQCTMYGYYTVYRPFTMSVIDGKRLRQAEYFAFCEEGADPSVCIGGHRLVSPFFRSIIVFSRGTSTPITFGNSCKANAVSILSAYHCRSLRTLATYKNRTLRCTS